MYLKKLNKLGNKNLMVQGLALDAMSTIPFPGRWTVSNIWPFWRGQWAGSAGSNPPSYRVVLCLGPAKGYPTGSWSLKHQIFNAIEPCFLCPANPVVQEGGCRVSLLGVNARHFFEGLEGNS